MNFTEVKKIINKKHIIIAAVVLLVIVATVTVIAVSSNNYKSAIMNYEKALSGKAKSIYEYIDYTTNGLVAKELKSIAKDLKEFDEEYYCELEDLISGKEFGKSKILIDCTEKINSNDLKDWRKTLHSGADYYLDYYLDDLVSDDIEDFADYYGVPKAKAQVLLSDAKQYCKTIKNAEFDEGYKVNCKITSDEDDFGEDITLTVVKIGNKWVIADNAFTLILKIISHYESSF